MAKSKQSIIERDVEFYTGMIEKHWKDMCSCQPGEEALHGIRRRTATVVKAALEAYKVTLEMSTARCKDD